MSIFLDRFRRITTTGEYYAAIDGLRFIAISLVVFFHISASIPPIPKATFANYPLFTDIIRNGWQGVELFFVISGFIIGLPFAKSYIHGAKRVSFKAFFLRRLTRLEPPYILMVLFALFLNVTFFHLGFWDGVKSASASLIYSNNLIYKDITRLVISVLWSLEIEVQFYILATILTLVYKFHYMIRRPIMIAVIAIMPYLQKHYESNFPSLYLYLQFFMIGLLLADLYLAKKVRLSPFITIPSGIASFMVLIYTYYSKSLNDHYLYLIMIFIFNYLVLTDKYWNRLFSIKIIATIGGMCYSIYLLHGIIISIFAKTIKHLPLFTTFVPQYIFNSLILVPVILTISGIYFLFIERPCMDKNWPNLLKDYLKKKFSNTRSTEII